LKLEEGSMPPRYPPTPYAGLLFIGDPHLEGRIPGFRKDEYPRTILEKLRWCLDYAEGESLLPVVLGDFFHLPRSNPNWLMVEVLQLFSHREIVGIYGNHDVHENTLSDHDSLRIVGEAGRMRLLGEHDTYRGLFRDTPLVLGGTPWGRPLPRRLDPPASEDGARPLVFWASHHDIMVPGYEEQGRIRPREIPGVHAVINGHIHRRLEAVAKGETVWMTPGNISRRARSDAARAHVPSVLRVDVQQGSWTSRFVEVPHAPFDEVFHEEVVEEVAETGRSAFVEGLAELQARRTQTGEGLTAFLERNLPRFDADVAEEIRSLAREVTEHE